MPPSKVLRWMTVIVACLVSGFGCLIPYSAVASAPKNPARLCDHAAERAAKKTGVPLDVLQAITRTETGKKTGDTLHPWPWTVNVEGKGVWFDTANQAKVYIFRHFKNGAKSFDIGCFQINYRWHGQAFDSIEDMFDPDLNASYAASYLKKLHSELGDWTKAVGAYHSRTHKYAQRYLVKYQRIKQALDTSRPAPVPRTTIMGKQTGQRINPIGAQKASLFPLSNGGAQSIFAPKGGG